MSEAMNVFPTARWKEYRYSPSGDQNSRLRQGEVVWPRHLRRGVGVEVEVEVVGEEGVVVMLQRC